MRTARLAAFAALMFVSVLLLAAPLTVLADPGDTCSNDMACGCTDDPPFCCQKNRYGIGICVFTRQDELDLAAENQVDAQTQLVPGSFSAKSTPACVVGYTMFPIFGVSQARANEIKRLNTLENDPCPPVVAHALTGWKIQLRHPK